MYSLRLMLSAMGWFRTGLWQLFLTANDDIFVYPVNHSALPSTTQGTPSTELHVFSTATSIFPAGMYRTSMADYSFLWFLVVYVVEWCSWWRSYCFLCSVSIKESSVAKLGSVCRRIYRIFSHAYFHHRQIFDKYEVSTTKWFYTIIELWSTLNLLKEAFLGVVFPVTVTRRHLCHSWVMSVFHKNMY